MFFIAGSSRSTENLAKYLCIRSYSIQGRLKPYSRFFTRTTSCGFTLAWRMAPESISAIDKKVAESAGGDAGELNELEDELDLMAAGGDKMDDSELGGDELLVVLIATDASGGKTGELSEPEDNKLESNVAGGDMTGVMTSLFFSYTARLSTHSCIELTSCRPSRTPYA